MHVTTAVVRNTDHLHGQCFDVPSTGSRKDITPVSEQDQNIPERLKTTEKTQESLS